MRTWKMRFLTSILLILALLFGTVAVAEPLDDVVSAPVDEAVEAGEADLVAEGGEDAGAQAVSAATVFPDRLTVAEGEKYDLKAVKGFKYKTTDKAVASVTSAGVINGKKAGKATITVKKSGNVFATIRLTVKKAPKRIDLNKTNLTLKAGKQYQLKATLPENTYTAKITWTSSDKAVAKVSGNGKVTALKAGTAKITAKASNGVKKACKVTVTAPAQARTDLKKYFWRPYSEARKDLGIGKDQWENDYIRIGGYGEPPGDSIEIIDIKKDPEKKYSLFGFYIGMTEAEVEKQLKARNWELYMEEDDWKSYGYDWDYSRTYTRHVGGEYDGHYNSLFLYFSSGIVDSVGGDQP